VAKTGKEIGIMHLTALNDEDTGILDINSIKWIITSGALATDVCEIKNTNGITIFKSICGTTGQFMDKDEIQQVVHGIKVTTLARGEVLIYLRDRARTIRR